MEITEKSSGTVSIRFTGDEIRKIGDPIMKHAEDFSSSTLNLIYVLKQQAYRMKNDFVQPPHAFGD